MADLPVFDAEGKPTAFTVRLTDAGDDVEWFLDGDFAGRTVEETIPKADLRRLLDEGGAYQEILGLDLQVEGEEVHGRIGVGSGNERFRIKTADLRAAIA